jgi:hypothetical protein
LAKAEALAKIEDRAGPFGDDRVLFHACHLSCQLPLLYYVGVLNICKILKSFLLLHAIGHSKAFQFADRTLLIDHNKGNS